MFIHASRITKLPRSGCANLREGTLEPPGPGPLLPSTAADVASPRSTCTCVAHRPAGRWRHRAHSPYHTRHTRPAPVMRQRCRQAGDGGPGVRGRADRCGGPGCAAPPTPPPGRVPCPPTPAPGQNLLPRGAARSLPTGSQGACPDGTPAPYARANQHSRLINSERAGPASAPRGTARPRRPRARPRTKMATAMYLEHYLDSKRPSRPPSPAPAQGTPLTVPHGHQALRADPEDSWGWRGQSGGGGGGGGARGAGRGRKEMRAGGAAQGPTVTAAPIPGASRRGGAGWRGAGLACHGPALPMLGPAPALRGVPPSRPSVSLGRGLAQGPAPSFPTPVPAPLPPS